MAMMTMTTSNSMNGKADLLRTRGASVSAGGVATTDGQRLRPEAVQGKAVEHHREQGMLVENRLGQVFNLLQRLKRSR